MGWPNRRGTLWAGIDEAQNQDHQAHQAQHAAYQQGAGTALFFAASDVGQRLFVGIDQVGTHLIECGAQWLVHGQAARGRRGGVVSLEKCLVVVAGFAEPWPLATVGQALVEQALEVVLQRLQLTWSRVRIQQQDKLLTQVLA